MPVIEFRSRRTSTHLEMAKAVQLDRQIKEELQTSRLALEAQLRLLGEKLQEIADILRAEVF